MFRLDFDILHEIYKYLSPLETECPFGKTFIQEWKQNVDYREFYEMGYDITLVYGKERRKQSARSSIYKFEWYYDSAGKLHRDNDQPAVVAPNDTSWYIHGKPGRWNQKLPYIIRDFDYHQRLEFANDMRATCYCNRRDSCWTQEYGILIHKDMHPSQARAYVCKAETDRFRFTFTRRARKTSLRKLWIKHGSVKLEYSVEEDSKGHIWLREQNRKRETLETVLESLNFVSSTNK